MTNPTWHLHMQLIRFAKGAIKAWEVWLNATSGAIEQPPPSGRRNADAREVFRE